MIVLMRRWIHDTVVLGLASTTVAVLALHIVSPQPGDVGYWPWPLGLMAFPVTSALILIRRPGNGVGRALGVVAVSTLLIFLPWWYAVTFLETPLSPFAELINEVAVLPQFGGIVALLFLFPTGRSLDRRFHLLLVIFIVITAMAMVLMVIGPGPMVLTGRPNPLGFGPDWGREAADLWFGAFTLTGVIGIVSLVMRRNRAGIEERAQLRWFLTAAIVSSVVFLLLDLVPEVEGDSGPLVILVGLLIAAGLFWSLPIAVVVAVLRYRLYEIDRIISRTVTYVSTIALLGGVYLVGLTALTSFLPAESALAVAGSTLAVAALFNPARKWIQDRVDRQFNRSRYDAQKVIDQFAGSLKDRLDSVEVIKGWVDVISETMQPTSVSVWLQDNRGPRNVFGTLER